MIDSLSEPPRARGFCSKGRSWEFERSPEKFVEVSRLAETRA